MFVNHPLIKAGTIEHREYQENLAKIAIENGRTLIVAPTALGKTIIAALVAVHFLERVPEKKVLFLAPTKPLANQHLHSFERILKLKELTLLTGETKLKERKGKWENAKVVFATPQTIKSCMKQGCVDLRDVSLLVVDEAHRAVGDYAYVPVSKRCASIPGTAILALTASPGSSKEKIDEVCRNLGIEHVEMRTEEDVDVKPYVHEKKIEWVRVDLPASMTEARELLKKAMKNIAERLKSKGLIENSTLSRLSRRKLLDIQKRLSKMKERTPLAFSGLSDVAELMKLQHAYLLLETQGIKQLKDYLNRLEEEKTRAARRIVATPEIIKLRQVISTMVEQGIEHPKMAKLVEIIKREGKQGIVFTHYRSSASEVEKLLNENGIRAKRFIGQTSREGEKGFSQAEQLEIINQFRKGNYQILVATAIGEEGLDIPSVDLVVFYEPVPSAIRDIQRAGRTGRKAAGKVIVLITRGTGDEAYYWSGRHKEREMKKIVSDMSSGKREKQKTLSEFAKPGKTVVFVDNREGHSGVIGKLEELGMLVKREQLPVGDFLLSDRAVVERKTTKDFVKSIIDGRLFRQAQELKRNFEQPMIIVEGSNLFNSSNVHPNAIRGALAAVVLDFGIPVIFSQGIDDTAALLAVMAKREQGDLGRVARLRGEKKTLSDRQEQIFIVESLPGVGPTLARELLKKFESVEGVLNATERELKQIPKIGEKKAKEIRRIIKLKYEE
ncbi:MAG: DEAD/DEAH box helicase [Candidatus Diapherotrites archaeon]|nr:DEAD/DEAH box helicase [Candidatus Diapherotrites archaeon]